jgi:hypothetical protein
MTRDPERRCITVCLFALFTGALTWPGRDLKELAVTLTPIAALLAHVIAFYFPRNEKRARGAHRGSVAPRTASGERDSGSCALHERGSSIPDSLG